MRHIFLIRHAHPDIPVGERFCLGRTDTPLGPLGRMQTALLREEFQNAAISALFSSPLQRCLETARAFDLPPAPVEALAEQDMGVWDALSFAEIRRKWPELYEKRGADPLLVPPGAETLHEVQQRAVAALERCLSRSEGDIALVIHASVLQGILAFVTDTPLAESRHFRLPYGGHAVLHCENSLSLESVEPLPSPRMTPALAEKLLAAAAPGEKITAHCRAVAAKAGETADAFPLPIDRDALLSAAWLHDIARSEVQHASAGAAWLQALGYEGIARLIRQHHDPEKDASPEALILYICDKCVQEDRIVSLEERFAQSAARCRDEEARAAHAGRLETARKIRAQINALCGREVIP